MLADAISRKLLEIQVQLGSVRDLDRLPSLISQAAADLCDADRSALFFLDRDLDRETGCFTRNRVAVALNAGSGEPLGVVEIADKKDGTAFTQADGDTLHALAVVASVAIENAILFQEHETQFLSFVETMVATADGRDPLTAGHSRLVSDYACGMAQEMGLSGQEVDVVRVAGLLHDYEQQARKGATAVREILNGIRFSHKYRHVPEIVASHHGYMDGSRYGGAALDPRIPFLANMITVADLFESLTADRHARRSMSAAEALSILKQGTGKRFDPAILGAMERYWQKCTLGMKRPVRLLPGINPQPSPPDHIRGCP